MIEIVDQRVHLSMFTLFAVRLAAWAYGVVNACSSPCPTMLPSADKDAAVITVLVPLGSGARTARCEHTGGSIGGTMNKMGASSPRPDGRAQSSE